VTVLDNPTHFTNPFQFEITFECLEPLNDGACAGRGFRIRPPPGFLCPCVAEPCSRRADLEWKLIYVGSAYDQQKDQVRAPRAADRACCAACGCALQLTEPRANRSWSRSWWDPFHSG
jgi:hypothetical protein